MNKDVIEKMRKEQEADVDRIGKLECFDKVSSEFDLEYAIAKELQSARQNASLSQKQLAEKMGTTQSVISRIEHGYNVSINTLEKYAQACGKHVEFHLV